MPYFKAVDSAAIDLLEQIFVYEPDSRLTAAEAAKHPYFQEYSDDYLPVAHRRFGDEFEGGTKDLDSSDWSEKTRAEVSSFHAVRSWFIVACVRVFIFCITRQ